MTEILPIRRRKAFSINQSLFHWGFFSGLKSPVIAFTSILSNYTTLGPRAVLKYDQVLTNWGGAYEPRTGTFTAPYDGLYSLSCTLISHPNNFLHLKMVKNGQKICMLYSAPRTYPQSAHILNVILNKGDRIWMQNHNSWNAKIHDGHMFNVFSGYLIKDL